VAINGKIIVLLALSFPKYSSSRAQVLFCAMVSGFDNVHVRTNLPRLEEAIKHGSGAGDR